MKLTDNERYEVKAEAFRIMTGHMAPGKDAAAASYPEPYEVRRAAFDAWWAQHAEAVRATLIAAERMVDGDRYP